MINIIFGHLAERQMFPSLKLMYIKECIINLTNSLSQFLLGH